MIPTGYSVRLPEEETPHSSPRADRRTFRPGERSFHSTGTGNTRSARETRVFVK